jgi:hypothetical protein
MLKKSASGVLASFRPSTYRRDSLRSESLEGLFRSPRSIVLANGSTKCGGYLLRVFTRCGLAASLIEHPAGIVSFVPFD